MTRDEHEEFNNHRGLTVWLTGLSGSGKSTIANALEISLSKLYVCTAILDGDIMREGLNKDLGFSAADRSENIRRFGEVAKILTNIGIVNIVAVISPYAKDRAIARDMQGHNDFLEVYVKTPLEVAEMRDPKGLYKRARAGEIKNFTGIDDPYEEPVNPDLIVDTTKLDVEECCAVISREIFTRIALT